MLAATMLILAVVGLCAQDSPNRPQANKNVLLDFFRLGPDLDARTGMLTDDYTQHNPRFLKMDEATGLKGKAAWAAAIRAGQNHARLTDPDFSLRSTPVAIVAEGDYVVAIYKATLPDPDDPSKKYEAFNFEMVLEEWQTGRALGRLEACQGLADRTRKIANPPSAP